VYVSTFHQVDFTLTKFFTSGNEKTALNAIGQFQQEM
jgi:hypothetical protein